MKRLLIITLVSLSLMGCASNQALRDQVSLLESRARQQDQQIAELKQQLAQEQEGTAEGVWKWIVQNSNQAWNSETSQDARDRARRCWEELHKKAK